MEGQLIEGHITMEAGQERLSGVCHYPSAEALTEAKGRVPGVVLVHGFMGAKVGQHRLFVKAARRLAKKGMTVLRFDFSGCGDSSGEHENIRLDRQVEELAIAISWLANQPMVDPSRIALIGLSLGGCVAALQAARDERVAKLVLWAPVANPLNELVALVGDAVFSKTYEDGLADFQGFALGEGLFHSFSNADPLRAIQGDPRAALILHGSCDREISPQNLKAYLKALPAAEGHWIDGADHTFSALKWEEELFARTEEWLLREGFAI